MDRSTSMDVHALQSFDTLSAPLLRALCLHLDLPLHAAHTLTELVAGSSRAQRTRCRRELAPLRELARIVDHAELCAVAAQRFAVTRPDWQRLLRSASTLDVAVRLYLEAPAAFLHAHRPLLLARPGELTAQRAAYIADVVPSRDRVRRMQEALAQLDRELGHGSSRSHAFADAHQLAIWTACEKRPFARRAFSFFFESGVLCVRAASRFEQARVSAAFANIFAQDPHYFDAARAGEEPRGSLRPLRAAALQLKSRAAEG